MKNINDPVHYRNYILGMLVATSASWQAAGGEHQSTPETTELEEKVEYLMTQLSPNRKTAMNILFQHVSNEEAA